MPLTLTTIFMTLTSYLMYHTIENPDVQIINELTLAKQQTEKALNAKSDFLASMSHELRTPLNAIVGLSQMIDLNDNLDEIHTDNKDILISSGKLLDIVDSILDLNKIDSKDIEIVEVQYNPTDVFNKIVDKLSIRLTEKPIELKTNYVGLPTTLYGDIDKIKTIINNLLSNSIKYTDSGYINFNVEYTDKEKLIITVSDTGRGISGEQKSKLFDRFSRREEDKDSDISGTGIGLALTKSLVDVLDGKIEVTSSVGEGSTFAVVVNQKKVDNNTENNTEIL
ncbi:MAG: HAMP domain-containing sensor histidine kinase [Bacilli bacterium]|nr:HAMP domain-containing sensor histidine kinase [Bacilli bacterium]